MKTHAIRATFATIFHFFRKFCIYTFFCRLILDKHKTICYNGKA